MQHVSKGKSTERSPQTHGDRQHCTFRTPAEKSSPRRSCTGNMGSNCPQAKCTKSALHGTAYKCYVSTTMARRQPGDQCYWHARNRLSCTTHTQKAAEQTRQHKRYCVCLPVHMSILCSHCGQPRLHWPGEPPSCVRQEVSRSCWCYFWPHSQTSLPYMRDHRLIYARDWTH